MTAMKPIGEFLPKQPNPDEVPLTEREQLILDLVQVGVSLRKAQSLVNRFPALRITRQLDWLPFRAARRPASMIIAAIENDYDETRLCRLGSQGSLRGRLRFPISYWTASCPDSGIRNGGCFAWLFGKRSGG